MANAKEKAELEKQAAMAVSLCPDDMTEGGGLLNNVRVMITAARFEMTNYGGRAQMMKPAALLVLEEPDGTVHEDQWWSCGKAEDWMPSDDGKYLIPTGLQKQINKSSNFGMLMQSFMDCGFKADKFSADINFLVGTEFHLQQVVAEGRDKVKSKDGTKEYEPTVPCAAEIFKFPWDTKKAASGNTGGSKTGGTAKKTVAKKKAAAKVKPSDDGGSETVEDGGNDLEALAMEVILDTLSNSEDGSVAKKALPVKIMQYMKENGHAQKVATDVNKLLFSSDEYLNREGQPWTYEGGIISLG
jgi:hypothetical protein